ALNTMLMAKAGGTLAINRVNLTFDDTTATRLPQTSQIVSGTYHPTSYAVSAPPFPIPAPPGPYNTNLSPFYGSNPNGPSSLYIFDDIHQDVGVLSNGWSLNLTTTTPVQNSGDIGITLQAPQTNVVATSNLTYLVTLTNYGPTNGSSIVVTSALPAGTIY